MNVRFPPVLGHDGNELEAGVVETAPATHYVSLLITVGELEAGWLLDAFAAEQLGKRLIAGARLIQAGAL